MHGLSGRLIMLSPKMYRTPILCMVVIGLWSCSFAGGQTAKPAVLSAELRTHVQADKFGIVTSIRGLPLGVRGALQTLFGTEALDIAEPGAEFQSSNANASSALPGRRLVAAGCSYEYCLVYYERGVPAHTWRVALFHWSPEGTRFEWGGVAPGSLASIEDVRRAVLSGAIKEPAGNW